MIQDTALPSAAADLREALEACATALAAGDLDTLTALDARIASALARLGGVPKDPAVVGRLLDDLVAARAALARCRRLGDGLEQFVRISLGAAGEGRLYDAALVHPVLTGRAIHARV